ncbi:hypothetical protein [Nocardiopsis rhodophaea]|uniref:hypothetical protein n=1 Tax=Nocardiopsis rhodophaea TaxID=280238 RepID=UPI0031E2F566
MMQLMAAGGTGAETGIEAIAARLDLPVTARAEPFRDPTEYELEPFEAPSENDRRAPREVRGDPARSDEEKPEKADA